jgi:hypothetical protein
MNERMLDKQHQPTEEEIKQFIGKDSYKNLQLIGSSGFVVETKEILYI